MRPGGGKSKGSAFERRVAKTLSLWLTDAADGTQLIRSVLSGGWRRGQQTQGDWRQVGDLAPNGPVGEKFRELFAVECKHSKTIDIHHLWTREAGLVQWWDKLVADCDEHALRPMLIFRPNCMPIMVGMQWCDLPKNVPSVARFEWHSDLILFPFDELLASCTGPEFLQSYKPR